MNRNCQALLLAVGLATLTVNASAEPGLTPFTAEYRLQLGVLRGEMTMSLEKTPTGFYARSEVKPRGLARLVARGSIDERAVFALDGHTLVPAQFASDDTLAKGGKTASIDFDWSRGLASGTNDDENFELPLELGSYDRLSIQYALMVNLMHEAEIAHYTMIDQGEVKELEVSKLGIHNTEVPFGTFDVQKIQHKARNSSRVTTLWCAQTLGYLPVRIEQHKNGKLVARAELVTYQPSNAVLQLEAAVSAN